MAVDDLISDPVLRTLLTCSSESLGYALEMLNWVDANQSDDPPLEARKTLCQLQKTLVASLAQLRSQNKRSIGCVRSTKQETSEARQQVDRLFLQLQNLYYEQRHLMGEISACESYDHAYARLPLLSLQDYLQLFPDQAHLEEPELMPRRIEHEKQDRERLEQERQELLKVKENLVKVNQKKKEELKKMDEQLEKTIEGMAPLGESLAQDI